MSLKTFRLEFYPVPASEFTRSPYETISLEEEISATEHCIKKWSGLTVETLAKHELKLRGKAYIGAGDDFWNINSKSCALCELHSENCDVCAIFQAHGRSCQTEYSKFFKYGDAKPMLELLNGTLAHLRNEENEQQKSS